MNQTRSVRAYRNWQLLSQKSAESDLVERSNYNRRIVVQKRELERTFVTNIQDCRKVRRMKSWARFPDVSKTIDRTVCELRRVPL